MKKFLLGVLASTGAFIAGKIIYNKGRADQSKETLRYMNDLQLGMKIGENSKKKNEES